MNAAILSLVIGCCCAAGLMDDDPPSALAAIPSRTDVDEILNSLRAEEYITVEETQLVARMVQRQNDWHLHWQVLNTIHGLKHPQPEFLDAVEELFRTTPNEPRLPFVKFKSAAILMKFRPELATPRQFVEPHLDSESKVHRMLAIVAFGTASESAKDVVPKLRTMLGHESQAVRVLAARSIWQLTNDPGEVMDTLIESLSAKSEWVGIAPRGFSEWIPNHRHIAASTLGQLESGSEKASLALCRLIEDGDEDNDEALRFVAFRAVASLGCDGDAVLKRLRRLQQDNRPRVAFQATETLEILLNQRKRI